MVILVNKHSLCCSHMVCSGDSRMIIFALLVARRGQDEKPCRQQFFETSASTFVVLGHIRGESDGLWV